MSDQTQQELAAQINNLGHVAAKLRDSIMALATSIDAISEKLDGLLKQTDKLK
jgi:uncharacterized coiled-coil DUF342 family protein